MYDVKTMTKKERKEKFKQNRVLVGFNTGTRIMKTDKHPTRNKLKKDLRKSLDNY